MNLYDFIAGFQNATTQDAAALMKALSAGYATSPDTQSGGGALRIESLERTMHNLTFTERNLVLWKDIPKAKAFNTVEEYNVINDYGSAGGFWQEGEKPEESSGDYQREVAKVKFVGVSRSVTHPMTLVNAVTEPMNLESINGLRELLFITETGLFWGNASGAAGSEYVEWDGLYNQVTNTYDARNDTLDKELMDKVAVMVTDNYGFPTDMYMSYSALSKFRRVYDTTERYIHPGAENSTTAGYTINQLLTTSGDINLKPSVLINHSRAFALGKKPVPNAASSSKAPNAPTLAVAVNADGTGNFTEGAGDYKYQVTLINRYGESAPCAVQTATLANATDSVTLTITSAASGETPQQAAIYRSNKGGSDLKLVARIPLTTANLNADTVWKDTCDIIAGRETLFLVDLVPDVMRFLQLTPAMRMPLAVIAPAFRFMILMYGVPIVYAPKKAVVIKNVAI